MLFGVAGSRSNGGVLSRDETEAGLCNRNV